ncbi:MAG: stalk domain-containing protein [Syntrophomonas sp.]|nr:stalk domain-containing protein [Syntrophomonas sp.]
MKKRLILPLAVLLTLLLVTPVFASVQLDMNGRTYNTGEKLDIQAGVTSAPIDVLAHTLGCTASVDGDVITLQENEDSLQMTIASTVALFNGQEKHMTRAPQRINEEIYLPIRFVYECFGASVTWKDTEEKILVSYAETRNGMNGEQLLTESSKKMLEVNRYKMTMDTISDIDMTAQENGQTPEDIKMQLDTRGDSWLQTDPMLIYIKQDSNIKMPENQATQEIPTTVQTEMLFNESGMYMTIPEYGWVKMDVPGINLQELMKQSLNQDPATAMKLMQDMGMAVSIANDQEKNGQKYWVVDAVMGGDIFKSDYFKELSTVLNMPSVGDIQNILAGMDLELSYSTWINQETLYSDYMDLDAKIKMDMDIPSEEEPGHIKLDMDMTGNYIISDYDTEFPVPDVSQAIDYETVINQAK